MYQEVNNSAIRDFDGSFPLLMPLWGYVVSALVLFMIGFFGFFLNLMVILLMIKDRQLWTPLNMILFNLVCSDFSVSILGNPFTLISSLYHGWIFGHAMCVLYGFFMALLGITSITTLTVLAFERYMLVSRPLTSKHLTNRGAGLIIVFIWTYSLALTTPPLMGWGNYVNEAANISCSVNWHEQSTNSLTYILYLFLMGQVVPMAVITYSYYNIVRTMKQNAQRLGRVSRAEAKVTAMVFVMILSFTVAWTPYSIFALLEQFATQGIVSPGAGVIPALVAKSSICYDPLIYVGMNTQFRQSIKRVFGIQVGEHWQSEKNIENTLISTHKISRVKKTSIKCSESHNEPKSLILIAKDKSVVIDDNYYEINTEFDVKNVHINNRNTINKTVSNPELYKDKLSNNDKEYKNLDIFGESCMSDSPVLNIVNSNTLLFSKNPLIKGNSGDYANCNVYSNKAFEAFERGQLPRSDDAQGIDANTI